MTTLTSRPLAGREESAPPGWGPLPVVLTGTFMTFLDRNYPRANMPVRA